MSYTHHVPLYTAHDSYSHTTMLIILFSLVEIGLTQTELIFSCVHVYLKKKAVIGKLKTKTKKGCGGNLIGKHKYDFMKIDTENVRAMPSNVMTM